MGKLELLTILLIFEFVTGELDVQPEQVHIAYGADPTQMVVSWVTFDPTKESFVEYGVHSLDLKSTGKQVLFVDGGPAKRKIYMHSVNLTNLTPGQSYVYHCGSLLAWSNIFYFTAMKSGTKWSPRFAVFGDMGNVNPQSLSRLQEETQRGHFDAVLHVGDFAYNMETDNAHIGDAFMRQVEAFAAYVPYMASPGNHENAYNFSNYKARFNMPGGDGQGLYYSYDVGPVHIISFSSELYYYPNWYNISNTMAQYKWLQNDLKKANTNRDAVPWVITLGHRPMYCSNNDHDDCTNFESKVRYGLEKLFYDAGVDLEFSAHEHSYERLFPLYNRTVCKGSSAPYTDPPAPVHIVTGSAGMYAGHDSFKPNQPYWSAFRAYDYGFTRMQVYNTTHLYLEQVSDEQDGKVVDSIWLIRTKHGAGVYSCP